MCSISGDGSSADDRTDAQRGGTGERAGAGGGTGTAEIAEIAQLGRALDELADAALAQDAEAADVAAILNRAWEMVTRLDPELARRLAGYSR
jgi:hypothetical protein